MKKSLRGTVVPILILFLALSYVSALQAQTSSNDANLQQAVAENDPAGVATVLNASPGIINNTNEDGWTPLMIAAYGGKTKAVQALLDRGASVDVKDPDG